MIDLEDAKLHDPVKEYRVLKWNGSPGVDHRFPYEVIQTGGESARSIRPTTVSTIDENTGALLCQLVTFEPEELALKIPRAILIGHGV